MVRWLSWRSFELRKTLAEIVYHSKVPFQHYWKCGKCLQFQNRARTRNKKWIFQNCEWRDVPNVMVMSKHNRRKFRRLLNFCKNAFIGGPKRMLLLPVERACIIRYDTASYNVIFYEWIWSIHKRCSVSSFMWFCLTIF